MATISTEMRERLLSYVSHQVAKGPAGIRETLQKGHDEILSLVAGMSDEQAKFKPSPDDWCVLEVLQHVIESQRSIARRCAELARGEQPAPIGRIGTIEQEPYQSLAEALAVLDAGHAQLLAFVDTISPETNLEAAWAHPWFGPLNCAQWAVFQRVHEGDHAGQIGQITSASGYPA